VFWLHVTVITVVFLYLTCITFDSPKILSLNDSEKGEISSSNGGEYDVQSCLLGYTAV
jgi:hypothetical protein